MTGRSHGSVLIVDDDEMFRLVLGEHLGLRRFDVAQARSIAETRALISSRSFDVVLLDQQLPDGDGVSLAEEMMSGGISAKVILVTAYAEVERAVEAMRVGVFDYLSKQVDLKELEIRI